MSSSKEARTLASAASPTEPSAAATRGLAVAIVHECGDWSAMPGCEQAIVDALATLAAEMPGRMEAGEVTIVLGDDSLLQRLNRDYRGKDAPTNVLAFPFEAPPGIGATFCLGDVILAAETVVREASERASTPLDHLRHLVVHGVLHLLGYDHDSEVTAEEMELLEVRILGRLGVADPYATPALAR